MKIAKINREVQVLSKMDHDNNISFAHFFKRALIFARALDEQYSSEDDDGFIGGMASSLVDTYFDRQNVKEKQAKIHNDKVTIVNPKEADNVAHNMTVAPVKFIDAIHHNRHIDETPLSIADINRADDDFPSMVELVTVDNEYDKRYVFENIIDEVNILKTSDIETAGLRTAYLNSYQF